MLFNCPTTPVGCDQEYWELILKTMKSQISRNLPRTWSKWSALKENVNQVSRHRREKTEGDDVPPLRNESPLFHELDYLIDRWNKIRRFREVQVSVARLYNTLKDFLGRSDFDDLVGDVTGEPELSVVSPSFSICLPEISNAIQRRRRQLEFPSPISESYGGIGRLDISEASSSTGDSMEHLTQQCRQTRNPDKQGSVVLGSTPTRDCGAQQEAIRHESMPTPGRSSPCPLRSFPDILGSPVPSASTDDEEVHFPELTVESKAGHIQTTVKPDVAYENSSAAPTSSGKRKNKSRPQKRDRNKNDKKHKDKRPKQGAYESIYLDGDPSSDVTQGQARTSSRVAPSRQTLDTERPSKGARARNGIRPVSTLGHTHGRTVSSTPALVTEENKRYAWKHAKPRAPVSVPHRSSPAMQPSPSESRPSGAEISTNTFYTPSWDGSCKLSEHTTQPAAETGRCSPIVSSSSDIALQMITRAPWEPTPSPSPTGQILTSEMVDCSGTDSSGVAGGDALVENEEFVMPDGETWYNQNTQVPLLAQSEDQEPGGGGPAVSPDNKALERAHYQGGEDASASRTAGQTSKHDLPTTRAGTTSHTRDGLDEAAFISGAEKLFTPSPPKSSKRKRDPSPSDRGSLVCDPFAPSSSTNSPAISISNASPPRSASRTKKRRKRALHCDSQDTPVSPKVDKDTRSSWDYEATPSPSALKVERTDGKDSRKQKPKGKGNKPWAEVNHHQNDRGQRTNHPGRRRNRPSAYRFTTPATAMTESPGSSALFVSSGSMSGGGGCRGTRQRWSNDIKGEGSRLSRNQDRTARESTVGREQFRLLPPATQTELIWDKLVRLGQGHVRLEEKIAMYSSHVGH